MDLREACQAATLKMFPKHMYAYPQDFYDEAAYIIEQEIRAWLDEVGRTPQELSELRAKAAFADSCVEWINKAVANGIVFVRPPEVRDGN